MQISLTDTMEEEKNDTGRNEGADITTAPMNEKPEMDEIELAKDENDFTAAEERKLIRKVCVYVLLELSVQKSKGIVCCNISQSYWMQVH